MVKSFKKINRIKKNKNADKKKKLIKQFLKHKKENNNSNKNIETSKFSQLSKVKLINTSVFNNLYSNHNNTLKFKNLYKGKRIINRTKKNENKY